MCVSPRLHTHTQPVSSSALHLLHKGLSVSPIMWRCLLRDLCPIRRPITTLDSGSGESSSLFTTRRIRSNVTSEGAHTQHASLYNLIYPSESNLKAGIIIKFHVVCFIIIICSSSKCNHKIQFWNINTEMLNLAFPFRLLRWSLKLLWL
jgi:hypothetical protein